VKQGAARRAARAAALALSLWATATWPALAVTSNDLIEQPERWDRKEVTYRGEVIGDVMRRGRTAVLNVSDGTYALGVWVPVRAAGEIGLTGRHGIKGDVVEVRGVYYRACPEHGGDPDLHAESLTVVEPGRRLRQPFHWRELYAALVLLVVALVLVEAERRRQPPAAGETELTEL
jgi:hypothetical protein